MVDDEELLADEPLSDEVEVEAEEVEAAAGVEDDESLRLSVR